MRILHRSGETDGVRWAGTPIDERGLALRSGAERVDLDADDLDGADALVVRFSEAGAVHAALIVAAGTRDLFVGGRRPLDVVLLDERAEIVLGGHRLYFVAREPLAVARCEGDAACGVCGEPARGSEAITCTHCAAVAHEGALADGGERLCFTHRGACPGCGLRREDFEWTPPEDCDA